MKYVLIPVKPEIRARLNLLKRYGDTYSTVIDQLIAMYNLRSAP